MDIFFSDKDSFELLVINNIFNFISLNDFDLVLLYFVCLILLVLWNLLLLMISVLNLRFASYWDSN